MTVAGRTCALWVLVAVIGGCNPGERSAAERAGTILGRNADEGARYLDDLGELGLTGEQALRTTEESQGFLESAAVRIDELAAKVDAEAIVNEAMCSVFFDSVVSGQPPTLDDIKNALFAAGLSQGDIGSALEMIRGVDEFVTATPDQQVQQFRILMLKYQYCP